MTLLANPSTTLRAEHGFTLMEMLVAMVSGMVVIIATLSILDISIGESSRISERVDADQRGRLALEKIMLELHSSCVASEFAPVQSESKGTSIIFVSQSGSEASFPAVTEHKITFASEGGGKLTDTSYLSSSGSGGTWTFPETATTTQTLLTGVSQSVREGVSVPVFQYYKYVEGKLSTTPETVPLSASDAKLTAEVTVSFTTAPSSGRTAADRQVDLTNTAVLRYDPASASGTNSPCA
jgi:Tfp pilus assembly protein PilW